MRAKPPGYYCTGRHAPVETVATRRASASPRPLTLKRGELVFFHFLANEWNDTSLPTSLPGDERGGRCGGRPLKGEGVTNRSSAVQGATRSRLDCPLQAGRSPLGMLRTALAFGPRWLLGRGTPTRRNPSRALRPRPNRQQRCSLGRQQMLTLRLLLHRKLSPRPQRWMRPARTKLRVARLAMQLTWLPSGLRCTARSWSSCFWRSGTALSSSRHCCPRSIRRLLPTIAPPCSLPGLLSFVLLCPGTESSPSSPPQAAHVPCNRTHRVSAGSRLRGSFRRAVCHDCHLIWCDNNTSPMPLNPHSPPRRPGSAGSGGADAAAARADSLGGSRAVPLLWRAAALEGALHARRRRRRRDGGGAWRSASPSWPALWTAAAGARTSTFLPLRWRASSRRRTRGCATALWPRCCPPFWCASILGTAAWTPHSDHSVQGLWLCLGHLISGHPTGPILRHDVPCRVGRPLTGVPHVSAKYARTLHSPAFFRVGQPLQTRRRLRELWQIATITMAADYNPWGVTLGGSAGHAVATATAVASRPALSIPKPSLAQEPRPPSGTHPTLALRLAAACWLPASTSAPSHSRAARSSSSASPVCNPVLACWSHPFALFAISLAGACFVLFGVLAVLEDPGAPPLPHAGTCAVVFRARNVVLGSSSRLSDCYTFAQALTTLTPSPPSSSGCAEERRLRLPRRRAQRWLPRRQWLSWQPQMPHWAPPQVGWVMRSFVCSFAIRQIRRQLHRAVPTSLLMTKTAMLLFYAYTIALQAAMTANKPEQITRPTLCPGLTTLTPRQA